MTKSRFQLASLCLLVMFAATVAEAQSGIVVDVPFNFLISDRTFPAGQYFFSSSAGLLTVQDSARKPVFIGIAKPVSGRRAGPTGQVVFHCYADRCFLSEYWTPARENGSQLLPSRFEAEAARHRRGTEFALLEESGKH